MPGGGCTPGKACAPGERRMPGRDPCRGKDACRGRDARQGRHVGEACAPGEGCTPGRDVRRRAGACQLRISEKEQGYLRYNVAQVCRHIIMTLLRKGDAALQWDQAWEFLEITVAHCYATSWNFQVTLQRHYRDCCEFYDICSIGTT